MFFYNPPPKKKIEVTAWIVVSSLFMTHFIDIFLNGQFKKHYNELVTGPEKVNGKKNEWLGY